MPSLGRSERFILAGQLWCNNERIWCLNGSIRKDLKRKPARYNSKILQWISPQAHAPTLPILPCTFSAVSPALCSAFRAPSPSVTSTAFITGHQALLAGLVEAARERGLVPSVLTFEPHPREFFPHLDPVPRISTLWRQSQAAARLRHRTHLHDAF